MTKIIITLLALALLNGCSSSSDPLILKAPQTLQTSAQERIRQVITAQQHAWNNGDLDGFMQGYWRSDSLRFASGNTYRFGWQTTLDNYKKNYPNKATMGRLTFDLIDIDQVSDKVAIVFGRWKLIRDNDQPQGLFTLVVEKKDGHWLITRDHTSSAK